MNHATLSKSPRLQAVLAYLRQRGNQGATTMQIASATNGCAIHSDIAELRANGLMIECEFEGFSEARRRVYRYRLIEGKPQTELALV